MYPYPYPPYFCIPGTRMFTLKIHSSAANSEVQPVNNSYILCNGHFILCTVVFKMFSGCFFASKKLYITFTALKVFEITDDVMTQYFV